MLHELDNTVALLERTPAALDELLRGLPEMWTESRENENSWTVRGVIAHLVYCEHENWMPRVKMILKDGEEKSFPPLDREGSVRAGANSTLGQLLDEFVRARGKSINELLALHLTPEDFERRGRHPVFGSVTLSQLLATWAAHDLTHLHQISRIMAHQYREAVGPWVRFLGVMHCAGHSE